jgi:predicted DNA-binding transcriptional regulator YafY
LSGIILFVRADRLLSLVLLLQANGKLSSRALAERLEVSERTVHRDMEALCVANVPVFATRGVRGGWQLDENWRTRVPGLDDAELRALLMAQPRAIGDPRLAASAERALAKLTAALPGPLRDQAAFMRQRLYVDPTGWQGTTEALPALSVVQDALARDRMLSIQYQRHGRRHASRTIHPLGLVAKGTTWYLVADTAKGLRTFRVSRIGAPVVLDAQAKRPTGFDLAVYWRTSTEEFRRRRRYVTMLRVERGVADALRTWCRVLPPAPGEATTGRKWVTLRVDFEDEDQALFMVLGFGRRTEVVEPARLRARVASEVAAMSKRLETHSALETDVSDLLP